MFSSFISTIAMFLFTSFDRIITFRLSSDKFNGSIPIGKCRSEQVVLSLLCVQCQPLLRKAEFSQIIEKYHMALDQ